MILLEDLLLLGVVYMIILVVLSLSINSNEPPFQENNDFLHEYFIASRNSDVYHTPGCFYVDRILPENVIYFEDEVEAELAGYRRSERC